MMRLLLVSLTACAMATLASAQTWSMELFYGAKAKQSAVVVSNKLTTFTHVLGSQTIDLDAFAGVFQDGTPVGGFSLGKRFKLADQVQGYAGFAFSVSQGMPNDYGPCFGVSVKF